MNILDVFYEEFIPEVSGGSVECFFTYNILFDVLIGNKLIKAKENIGSIIPTLKITDKRLFDSLLIEYVKKSLDFYEFEEEIKDDERLKIKKILTFLFANASIDDFENPVNFLKKKINFLEDKTLMSLNDEFLCNTLDAKICIKTVKASSTSETPYKVKFELVGEDGKYNMPSIYVGLYNDKAYVYAIQKEKDLNLDSKKIKRNLYKIDDGLDDKEDNFENYGIGNLKDVTPSFLLAVNILIGILNEKGIDKIVVPSILPLRWNAKEIANYKKGILKNYSSEDMNNMSLQHEQIQSNLTEKLIRTFLRLVHHHSGIDVVSYPTDGDFDLNLSISKSDKCNNPILAETYNFYGGRHV